MDTQQGAKDPVVLKAERAGWVALLIVMLIYGVYFLYFRVFKALSVGSPEAWGQFGDYIGGLLNPVIGLVTIYLVIVNLKVIRKEAEDNRRELASQNKTLRDELEDNRKRVDLEDRSHRLSGLLSEWNRMLDREYNNVMFFRGSEPSSHKGMLGWKLLNDPLVLQEMKLGKQHPRFREVESNWKRLFLPHAEILLEFRDYCMDYDERAGDRLVSDFYRRRVAVAAELFFVVGLIDELKFRELLAPATRIVSVSST